MMAMSLGFHILLAVAGMAMPLLMVIAEYKWYRTKNPVYLELAKRWSKGTAILFAIGAVSGTALSFELGLLWPKFMQLAGPVIGLPLSMELYAFFLEAIALGIYLYGWKLVGPVTHILSGVMVLLSGVSSAVFIVTANAWMNVPVGFDLVDGIATNIKPWQAMWNPMAFSQTLHMVLAAFSAIGFVVTGIHAKKLLRDPSNIFDRRAFAIAMLVGGIASLIQPLSGDLSAKAVAKYQPVKLAAIEAQWETERRAPLRIGGFPFVQEETTKYAIELPGILSFLATGDFDAEIKGLKSFPKEVRPPIAITHFGFQIMVGLGSLMALISAISLYLLFWRKIDPLPRWLLRTFVVLSPAGLIALEAGWITTEVGRQPWIISGIMRSTDALTPMPHLIIPFLAFTALYALLGIITLTLLRMHIFQSSKLPLIKEEDDKGNSHAA